MKPYGLIADIGGTHVRFAMVDIAKGEPVVRSEQTFSTKDHPDIVSAARRYLDARSVKASPEALVFAVAGPVEKGEIHLTNAGWNVSAVALREGLGTNSARLVNDFEAVAYAVPHLRDQDLAEIGPSPALDLRGEGTIAIVGPGTGLGIAGLVRNGGARVALVTEGGHAALAPVDALEMRIVAILMKKFGRVSGERILSGPGLLNLHAAMAEIENREPADQTSERITQIARDAPQSFEARVFARFCEILGSVAGDVALMMGARQGVLIAGGILPATAKFLAASGFRRRFEDKARFTHYMQAIPTRLILEPQIGLIGAAAILLQDIVAK